MTKSLHLFLIMMLTLALSILWLNIGDQTLTHSTAWWGTGVVLLSYFLLARYAFAVELPDVNRPPREQDNAHILAYDTLRFTLRHRHGWNWKHKMPWMLVTGEMAIVEKAIPGLTQARWLESQNAVLLWCGEPDALDFPAVTQLRKLRGRRAFNAALWVTDVTATPDPLWKTKVPAGQHKQLDSSDAIYRQFIRLGRVLNWRPPVFAMCLNEPPWEQDDRPVQSIGYHWTAGTKVSLDDKNSQLAATLIPLGMTQLSENNSWAWLLQLSRNLTHHASALLKQRFQPWLGEEKSVLLRGLFFVPPAPVLESVHQRPHVCLLSPAWDGVIAQSQLQSGRRDRLSTEDKLAIGTLTLAGLAVLCMAISAYNNCTLIASSRALLQAGKTSVSVSEKLTHSKALQDNIDLLLGWQQNGSPWLHRFGLDRRDSLVEALWPAYMQQSQALMITPIAEALKARLKAFVSLPPGSTERRQAGKLAYQQLKAYLMLLHPQHADPAFMQPVLSLLWTAPDGVTSGEWLARSDKLLGFYLHQLPLHVQWKLPADDQLVANVRTALHSQKGISNSENSLYQQVLLSVSPHYADVTLDSLLGDSAGSQLFSTHETLAGIFTREAWEGEVSDAIDKAAAALHVTSDWVLDVKGQKQPLTKDQLKYRLTERYFADYTSSWLNFLNSIRWNSSDSLSTSLDQLTLLADVRQSPLLTLSRTLRYQATAGQNREAMGDSLLKSAQKLVSRNTANDALAGEHNDPTRVLNETFAPLLEVLAQEKPVAGETHATLNTAVVSLSNYLLQVTQTRLQLLQVANASDPQALAQSLMKSAFTSEDTTLSQGRHYAQLLAASLGGEWRSFADAAFVQPLEQAWNGVMSPAQQGLNSAWQSQIQTPWQVEFIGRYPFDSTKNDASFEQLAHYLTPNTGLIDQFITQQLAGVLEKQGDSWVPNPLNTQGIAINRDFLDAVNHLSQLGRRVFLQGQASVAFELQIRPTRNVVETDLQIDDASLKYFNQMPAWQTMRWPDSASQHPQVALTYSPVEASGNNADTFRIYFQADGNWAWLRLLDKAQVVQLDSSRYLLSWQTDTKQTLNAVLRTQSGAGPLELLALRHFKLPTQIFSTAPHVAKQTGKENDDDAL